MAKAPRSLVLGTAGHIDHGKTTLVRALTGQDTDRLPEEKRRGITIELGFAPFAIAPGLEASLVDVPGHEGFVRTMVAGAGGIDAVILVVSAEDGVMPQTREHVNVCRLLGVQHGVVALTKVDRLEDDPEAIELAVADVREALEDTVFADAPIVPCSGHTGAGLEDLRGAIAKMASRLPPRDPKGEPIIPLDRVFTIKGHGTVVTGTLLRGTIEVGRDASLTLLPQGEQRPVQTVRARAAQVRGTDLDRVVAGSRIALNLAIDKDRARRGDVLTRGVTVVRGCAFHALLHHLPGSAAIWKAGTTLQVCVGTAHAVGRLDPLWSAHDEAEGIVPPGHEALVRVRLDSPLPLWRGARVIVRAFSDPSRTHQGLTVGGGEIVDPEPSEGRGQRQRWIALGRALAGADPTARVVALVRDAGAAGIGLDAIVRRSGVADAQAVLDKASGKRGEVVALGNDRFVHEELLGPLGASAITAVDRYHAENPLRPGLPRATLEALLGGKVAPDVAAFAIDQAIARGALRAVDDQGTLARPGKGLDPAGELSGHMKQVLDLYERGGFTPPTIREVEESTGLRTAEVVEIVGALQRTGRLVKVTQELSFSKEAHGALVDKIRRHLAEAGTIDVQALKAISGLTRKFVVPFLEHLDQLQITLRRGDTRFPGPRA